MRSTKKTLREKRKKEKRMLRSKNRRRRPNKPSAMSPETHFLSRVNTSNARTQEEKNQFSSPNQRIRKS